MGPKNSTRTIQRRQWSLAAFRASGRVDAEHDMKMIAHHRVGIHRYGEAIRELEDAHFDPRMTAFRTRFFRESRKPQLLLSDNYFGRSATTILAGCH